MKIFQKKFQHFLTGNTVPNKNNAMTISDKMFVEKWKTNFNLLFCKIKSSKTSPFNQLRL